MGKPPKWMRRHIQICRAAFGINGPADQLYVQRQDRVTDNPAVYGETVTTPRYGRATITLRRDVRKGAEGYEDVTHEILHAAMPLHLQTVKRIIDLLPADQQAHAWDLWNDANEATVTRLARGLTPILRSRK